MFSSWCTVYVHLRSSPQGWFKLVRFHLWASLSKATKVAPMYLSTWLPSTTTKRVHIPSMQRKRKSSRMPTGTGREIHGRFFPGMLYASYICQTSGTGKWDACMIRVFPCKWRKPLRLLKGPIFHWSRLVGEQSVAMSFILTHIHIISKSQRCFLSHYLNVAGIGTVHRQHVP